MEAEFPKEVEVPGKIILDGVVGSQAYGLATPDSDFDIKGIFVTPTLDLVDLSGPKDTKDHSDPDWAYHEVGKFMRLAMDCNPTIMELLYLDHYNRLSVEGEMLVNSRWMFLSRTKVFAKYGGYARSKFKELELNGEFSGRTKNRREKNARHLFRLLDQGTQLLRTGSLSVRVEDPEFYFEAGRLSNEDTLLLYEEKEREFNQALQNSVLPEHPDREGLNHRLRQIRWGNWC